MLHRQNEPTSKVAEISGQETFKPVPLPAMLGIEMEIENNLRSRGKAWNREKLIEQLMWLRKSYVEFVLNKMIGDGAVSVEQDSGNLSLAG